MIVDRKIKNKNVHMNRITDKKKFIQRDSNVNIYLNEIRKEIPDADVERKLLETYYSADSTPEQKLEARNKVITMNQKLVYSIAKSYSNNDDELLMDLVIVGSIGMNDAFEKYNLETDNRFCTYAKWYIQRAITRFLNDENLLIRPTNNMRITPKVKKIEEEFEKTEHRKPTVEEVERILNEKYDIKLTSKMEIAPVVIDSITPLQTDASERDVDMDFSAEFSFNNATAIGNIYEDEIEKEDNKAKVQALMSVLSEREAQVIKMAFGFDSDGYMKEYNNNEIGEALDLTPEAVRQIKKRAMAKLQLASTRSSSI